MRIGAAIEEALAEALRRTGSVPIACRGAGITPRQLEQALAGDEALRDRLEHALLDGHARIDEEIYTRAFGGAERVPMLQRGKLVFGWWDDEAGGWIDPDTWPGGELALHTAASAPGATIRRAVVTRAGLRESRILVDYAKRHVAAYRKPEQGGPLGAPSPAAAPERAAAIEVPAVVLTAQEWAAKTRVTDAPEG